VPEWYIASCKKIKYLFPKGHAVAYVTNSFRIGYFKINFPHAFYAATFSVKYEYFDYNLLCFGVDKVKAKIAEVESLGKDKAQQKDLKSMPVFELVVEMYARGIGFAPIDLYNSAATKFKVVEVDGEKKLLPPLCTLPGFGTTVADSLVEAREQGRFENIEEMQQRTGMGKKMVALLKENGVLDGMRETDQLTIFEDLA
jgi:DNA polymerase-3 subunit alpha (Gram-positive type)